MTLAVGPVLGRNTASGVDDGLTILRCQTTEASNSPSEELERAGCNITKHKGTTHELY
jgi:hypothetical protein